MQGRYGMDQLGRFLLFAALALIILSFFFGGMILDTIALALLVWGYIRMFSRNHTKRWEENEKVSVPERPDPGPGRTQPERQHPLLFSVSCLRAEGESAQRKRENFHSLSQVPYGIYQEDIKEKEYVRIHHHQPGRIKNERL